MIEVRCYACTASTAVYPDGRRTIAQLLQERGWRNDRGVIGCRAYAHVTVMPRHTKRPKALEAA